MDIKFTQCNLDLEFRSKSRNKQIQTTVFGGKSVSCQTPNFDYNKKPVVDEPPKLPPIAKCLYLVDKATQYVSKELKFAHSQTILKEVYSVECQTDDLRTTGGIKTESNYAGCSTPSAVAMFQILFETLNDFPNLDYKILKNPKNQQVVKITNSSTFGLLGPDVETVEATIRDDLTLSLIIPFRETHVVTVTSGTSNNELRNILIDIISPVAGQNYVACPGLKNNEGNEITPFIPSKKITKCTVPFLRVHSVDCPIWYEREGSNRLMKAQCTDCRKASKSLSIRRKRVRDELDTTTEEERSQSTSNYSFFNLSLEGQKKRLISNNKEKRELKQRVKKLESQLEHKDSLLKF